jgi:hypothetical protein
MGKSEEWKENVQITGDVSGAAEVLMCGGELLQLRAPMRPECRKGKSTASFSHKLKVHLQPLLRQVLSKSLRPFNCYGSLAVENFLKSKF